MIITQNKANQNKQTKAASNEAKISDSVLLEYLNGEVTLEDMREHVKVEEQKWIRKAKKFSLYDDLPYRIK